MSRKQEVGADPEPGDEDPYRHDFVTAVIHRRAPAKKNTRSWCKGKVGREHILSIEVPANTYHRRPCGWWVGHGGWPERDYYDCAHVEMCTACGKVFRRHYGWMTEPEPRYELSNQECPDFTPPREATTD